MDACRDPEFWRWSACTLNVVFLKTERCRKWGMICNHETCREQRRQGKSVTCPENSRRLDPVKGHVERECNRWLATANALELADAENSNDLYNLLTVMLRSGQDQLRLKTQPMTVLPHRFCVCDTWEGCCEVYDLIHADGANHELLTRRWIQMHGKTIEQVLNTSLFNESSGP